MAQSYTIKWAIIAYTFIGFLENGSNYFLANDEMEDFLNLERAYGNILNLSIVSSAR